MEVRSAVRDDALTAARGEPVGPARQLRRRRGLPGGRAVVGALLVAASAVGVFAAYLSATAAPSTAYLVAGRTIEPGTRFASLDDVFAAVGRTPLDLPPTAAGRAIRVEDAVTLVGRVVVSPLERGDLLTRTAFVEDGGVADAQTLSFSVPEADAVDGSLRPGERIDVIATHGSGGESFTAFVARGLPLLRVSAPDGTVAGPGRLTLTVAVSALDDVLALSHAAATAEVRVTRSTAGPAARDPAPGAYRATPLREGPQPESAGDPVVGPPVAPGGDDGQGGTTDADVDEAAPGRSVP
jgi:Flp pilus assembly protein CpaB